MARPLHYDPFTIGVVATVGPKQRSMAGRQKIWNKNWSYKVGRWPIITSVPRSRLIRAPRQEINFCRALTARPWWNDFPSVIPPSSMPHEPIHRPLVSGCVLPWFLPPYSYRHFPAAVCRVRHSFRLIGREAIKTHLLGVVGGRWLPGISDTIMWVLESMGIRRASNWISTNDVKGEGGGG